MSEPLPSHWVRIDEGLRHLGAGLLVTRGFVLTALHCLRDLSSPDAVMDLRLADGRELSGRLCDAIKDADLALIAVEYAHTHGLPPAPATDWPRPQVSWQGAYLPPGETTRLSGMVTHAPVRHRVEDRQFTGLQLTVDQEIGDFHGYSGSPVDTEGDPQGALRRVVGILMEQEPRRDEAAGQGSNVLYAASVRHALELFPYFDVEHLRWLVSGAEGLSAEPRQPERPASHTEGGTQEGALADAQDFLASLRAWEESGLISRAEAEEQRRGALRKLSDRLLGRGADGA
ncbi:serine protease [Streptomyces sp. NPDC020747]|uniref:serine protease n=1 Tax=Streptomyces sp. NPDC020747 TaxID=3365086 RepID=UPI00378A7910